MTSDGDTTSDGTPSETGRLTVRDGDVISLGSQMIRDSLGSQMIRDAGGSMPLTMQWEIKIATSQHGKLLAQEQATAIREVLAWIARERSMDEASE